MAENTDKQSFDFKDTEWYLFPLPERNQIVGDLNANADKIIQLSREVGVNVGTTTTFGRSYDILETSLPYIRRNFQAPNIKVLDIGPGMGFSSIVEACHHHKVEVSNHNLDRQYSSEPFELEVALQKAGFTGTKLIAFDIDPLVLAIIDTQRELVVERFDPNQASYYQQFLERVDPNAEEILGDEIKAVNERNKKYPEEHYKEAHLVELPQSIRKAISTEQGDIANLNKQSGEYDLIYYMAVDIYVENKEETLMNIAGKVKNGGLIITSEIKDPSNYGLEEVTRVDFKKPRVCYKRIIKVAKIAS